MGGKGISNSAVIQGNIIKILQPCKITFEGQGNLFVNGVPTIGEKQVDETSKIEYKSYSKLGEREYNIILNSNKSEAKFSTSYTNGSETSIVLVENQGMIFICEEILNIGLPKPFTEFEIKGFLASQNIIFGIQEEVIKEISEKHDVKDVCIAKGIVPIDGVDDKVNVVKKVAKKNIDDDSLERVDYKEKFPINYVRVGEVIGEIKRGIVGVDGKDVFGNPIPKRQKRRLEIKASAGCRCENDKFIATIDGQPLFKGSYFTVNPLLTIQTDVDMQSGNIRFSGDLFINGDIKDDMEVIALGSIEVAKGIYRASVTSNSGVTVNGNTIGSKIKAGASNVVLQNKIEYLNTVHTELTGVYKNITYLKSNRLINPSTPESEVIRGLLETKYKNLVKTYAKLLELFNDTNSDILKNIENLIGGKNIVDIKSSLQVIRVAEQIKILHEEQDALLNSKYDLNINTAYESTCESSGNIIVKDKGVVACDLFAGDKILFEKEGSTCRGGHLKATNFIQLWVVGSETGGRTTLEVSQTGKIVIDKCYKNTLVIVGNKRYSFEENAKMVEVYLDKKGDIHIDKLSL